MLILICRFGPADAGGETSTGVSLPFLNSSSSSGSSGSSSDSSSGGGGGSSSTDRKPTKKIFSS